MSIEFQRPGLLFLLLPAALSVILPPLLSGAYRPRRLRTLLPSVFRLLCAVCVVFLLAGVTVCTGGGERNLIILADISDSVSGSAPEIASDASYLQAYAELNGENARLYAFDGGIRAAVVRISAGGDDGEEAAEDDGGSSVTDIGGALLAAKDLLSGTGENRVILLSDGNETAGNARRAAAALAAAGIRIDAKAYGADLPEIQLSSFALPRSCGDRETIAASAVIDSTVYTRVRLRLLENDEFIEGMIADIVPGRTTVPLTLCPGGEGEHRYRLLLELGSDTLEENNEVCAVLTVGSGGSGTDTGPDTAELPYDPEYDVFAGGEGLLAAVCEAGGGIFSDDIRVLAGCRADPVYRETDPSVPLLCICAVLFLTDTALRRLTADDIRVLRKRLSGRRSGRAPEEDAFR